MNSIATHRSLKGDEGVNEDPHVSGSVADTRGRKRTGSRASIAGTGSMPTSSSSTGRPYSSGSAPTIRSQRVRTTSVSSSISSSVVFGSTASQNSSSMTPASFPTSSPDNTQTGLEKVIKSRLVETFLVISIPSIPNPARDYSQANNSHIPPNASQTPRSSTPRSPSSPMSPKSKTGDRSTLRKSTRPSPLSPGEKSPASRPTTPRSPSIKSVAPAHSKHPTVSPSTSRSNGLPSPASSTNPSRTSTPPPPMIESSSPATPIPDYLSSIHQPSTNPFFPVDPRSEFSSSSELSGDRLNVEVWARIGKGLGRDASVKGKEKAKEESEDEGGSDWKVLEEWSFSLSQLIPVPEEVSTTISYHHILSDNYAGV